MRVLLIQCPCSFGVEIPPLGLAYLSAFLKQHDIEVSVLDLSIALYHTVEDSYKQYWHSNKGYCWYLTDVYETLPFLSEGLYQEYVDTILSDPAEVVGFSVQNTSALFTLEIIKRIRMRKSRKKIILGGPNCFNYSGDDADFTLHHDLHLYADAVVVGEGEATLLNAVRRIQQDKTLQGCKGVAAPAVARWSFSGFAKPITDLDSLPFPDFDAFPLSTYTDRNSLPLITSRGCVMKCVFCTDTYFWNPYRFRSADNIFTEIIRHKTKYKNRFFGFNDSLINGNLNNLLSLNDKLLDSKIDIKWGGNCRIDKRLTPEFLRKFNDAGCEYITIGIESGSDKILRLMRKGFTVAEVEQFLRLCKDSGIDVVANWIIGFPGEENEDFEQTVSFINRNKYLIKSNTFSTLTINQFSYLAGHIDEFDIILNGPHLGLWESKDGSNNIEIRNARLRYLEDMENRLHKDYSIVRQTGSS